MPLHSQPGKQVLLTGSIAVVYRIAPAKLWCDHSTCEVWLRPRGLRSPQPWAPEVRLLCRWRCSSTACCWAWVTSACFLAANSCGEGAQRCLIPGCCLASSMLAGSVSGACGSTSNLSVSCGELSGPVAAGRAAHGSGGSLACTAAVQQSQRLRLLERCASPALRAGRQRAASAAAAILAPGPVPCPLCRTVAWVCWAGQQPRGWLCFWPPP